MFRNAYQKGLVSVLFSGGSRPLAIWGSTVQNGQLRRVMDDDADSLVLELTSSNVATTYIYSPPTPRGSLALRLPFFTMIVKNLNRYFTFEIQILDDQDMRRRFRLSNSASCTAVHTFCSNMPVRLNAGWNLVQLNLADFVWRTYGTTYIETQRIQLHANCRIRRIYFSDRVYSEEELPADYVLHGRCRREKTTRQRKPADPKPEPPPAAKEPPAAFAELIGLPSPETQHIQITLPEHSSLGVSVPPPSDTSGSLPQLFEVESSRSDFAEPSAPDELRTDPTEPAEITAPDEMTEGDSAPDEMTEGISAPDQMIEGISAPDEMTEGISEPDQMIEGISAPDEMTEGASAPDEMTEGASAPDEMTEGASAPDEMTEGASAPEEPSAQTTAADDSIASE